MADFIKFEDDFEGNNEEFQPISKKRKKKKCRPGPRERLRRKRKFEEVKNEREIIYNDLLNDRFCSIKINIETLEKEIFECPIYAIHPNGEYGLGINFERLYETGGYGYDSQKKNTSFVNIPDNDGIFRIDFSTGEKKLVISISDVAKTGNYDISKTKNHFLSHITFNPNGSLKNIAGIFNKEKNVLGMMPHPERMIDQSLSGEDGSLFFKSLINNIK